MFKLLKKLTKPKNENSYRFRLEMAEFLNGRHIRYVTERENDSDTVIGHDGCLAIHNDEFLVMSDGVCKFRTYIKDLHASELMSLEGVILSGPDLESDSLDRTVIAYYKYYR